MEGATSSFEDGEIVEDVFVQVYGGSLGWMCARGFCEKSGVSSQETEWGGVTSTFEDAEMVKRGLVQVYKVLRLVCAPGLRVFSGVLDWVVGMGWVSPGWRLV